MKVEKYPTESQKLQDAIKKARRLFKGLAKEYTEDTVKKAFFRVQKEISKRQALLREKEETEKKLAELDKKLI